MVKSKTAMQILILKQLRAAIELLMHISGFNIHTDAIKENLIPATITSKQAGIIYANEADVLNMALFGKTSKQWRDANPDKKGNIRDFANLEQLVVLSNMESTNALLIHQGLTQSERLLQLNQMAISQMKSLVLHRKSLETLYHKD